MPPAVRRSLTKLGGDISIARRKRALTVQMMAERLGVSRSTYLRAERGDGRVAMAVYGMALFVLGFGPVFGEIADQARDDRGLLLDRERLPRRVRPKREPTPP